MTGSSSANTDLAHGPSTIRLGDREVFRLGYGAMRLPGPEVWGEPSDPEKAKAVLRKTIDLGINLIDTAWYYGPFVSNRLIAETLYPYPKDLVIATKLGGKRLPDKSWASAHRPEELRQGCEHDLRSLRLERLEVVHLRYMKGEVPFLEMLDAMIELKKEGKIGHLALSNVNVQQIDQALERTAIVAVQNLFNVSGAKGQLAKMAQGEIDDPEAVLRLCETKGIAFLPFFPLAVGSVGKAKPPLQTVAQKHGATPAQIAIAWLLARSPVMLPIPGTSSPGHLQENWEARRIKLSSEDMQALS